MVVVTNNNVRNATFKNVRNILSGNITDIGTRVYGSYPLKNITLPLIVVESPLKTNEEESTTLNQANSDIVVVNITVYSKAIEKANRYMDSIDSIISTSQSIFTSDGLYISQDGLEDIDEDTFIDLNKQRSHSKTSAVTFMRDRN